MNRCSLVTRLIFGGIFLFSPHLMAQQTVKVGLRWLHQFQFAGYYAAVDQGYYAEEGLNVELIPGAAQSNPIEEVIRGDYDFAIANGELILARLQGRPVVAIAAMMQYSPSAVFTLASSGIDSAKKLAGKRIMTVGGRASPELLTLLDNAALSQDQITLVPQNYQLQSLINGEVDAFSGYLSTEPYLLSRQGIEFNSLLPANGNVDFYSDFLFTSQALAEKNPGLIRAFRRATLKGWRYALAKPEQMVNSIKNKWGSPRSLNELRYEALSLTNLIRPELVEIGYINEERIEKIAQIFVDHGLAKDTDNLEGLVYHEALQEIAIARHRIVFLSLAIASMAGLCLVLLAVTRKLHQEVKRRKEVEAQLRILASVDPLTGLLNRRSFNADAHKEECRTKRTQSTYSIVLLDIDLFKTINDQFGHSSGDNVIKEVARQILDNSREIDICARFGGEEFIILLPETSVSQALNYTQRLRDNINAMTFDSKKGQVFQVTASYGVAEWDRTDTLDGVINQADQALYLAKRSGRDCIRAWSHTIIAGNTAEQASAV